MTLETYLNDLNQNELLRALAALDKHENLTLIQQLENIQWKILKRQIDLLSHSEMIPKKFTPPKMYHQFPPTDALEKGKTALRNGSVAGLVLAGGLGTRLGHKGPKGTYPITSDHRSLFELFAEQTLKAKENYGPHPYLAIMTSPQNDADTRTFFKNNHFFGLDPSRLSFYSQSQLPYLDEKGNLILNESNQLCVGPDGNGRAIEHLIGSKIAEQWQQSNIHTFTLIPVDNALANLYDPEWIGTHLTDQADITLKVVSREDPHESVGVIVNVEKQVSVIEYTELDPNDREAKNSDGQLLYPLANTSQFCFSLDWVLSKGANIQLPLHKAWKTTHVVKVPKAWKFETFIFDLLPHATSVSILVQPRSKCFAPLKNPVGSDSPETVRRLLAS